MDLIPSLLGNWKLTMVSVASLLLTNPTRRSFFDILTFVFTVSIISKRPFAMTTSNPNPNPNPNRNRNRHWSTCLRGVFVGSGSDGMSDPRMADIILDLIHDSDTSSKKGDYPTAHVLYLGTATYDLPQFAERQTRCFVDRGCHISMLNLVHETPSPTKIRETIDKADIVVVGGGNTLFAVDRWNAVPAVVDSLRAAMERGAILTGGSAGAMCWFDGGHSDSMDPDTYYRPMMQKYGHNDKKAMTVGDESSDAPSGEKEDVVKDWKYTRIPALGFLPGVVCPHHDRIQSNGDLRAHDFDRMLLQHPGELGIGIDHWAALVVEGDDFYRVVSLEDKPGSVLYYDNDIMNGSASFSADANGVPGIWIKRVVNGQVVSTLLPPTGKLSEVLSEASDIVQDDEVLEQCRKANPHTMV